MKFIWKMLLVLTETFMDGFKQNIRKPLSTRTHFIPHLISQEKGAKVSRLWKCWT